MARTPRISVLVVENHPTMREAIASRLTHAEDMAVMGPLPDAERAIEWLRDRRPDLLLTDYNLPKMSGLELTRWVARRWPDLPVLMLSGQERSVLASRAFEAGAEGYLTKGEAAKHLETAIRHLARGDEYRGPEGSDTHGES